MLVYDGRKFIPVSAILNRPEILALSDDLGLEYVGRSFGSSKWVHTFFTPETLKSLLITPVVEKPRSFGERFSERNHRRKIFKNVYPTTDNYTQFTFDWD